MAVGGQQQPDYHYNHWRVGPTLAPALNKSHDDHCFEVKRLLVVCLLGVLMAYLVFRFAVIPYEDLQEDRNAVVKERDVLKLRVALLEQRLNETRKEPLHCNATDTQHSAPNLANLLQDNERCKSDNKFLEGEIEAEKSLLGTCQSELTDHRKKLILCESKIMEGEKENSRAHRIHQKCQESLTEAKSRMEQISHDCTREDVSLQEERTRLLVELEKCKTSGEICISKLENTERKRH